MTPAVVVYTGLLLARLGAFVAVMPVFAARTPRMVRVGLVMALAAFYLGSAAPGWDPAMAAKATDVHPLRMAIALAREALVGAAMGFAFGLFLLPARIAGEFLTQQVGLNVSQSAGLADAEAAGPLTNLLETAAALVFLAADGHHVVFGVLHASFAALPLGGPGVPQATAMVDGLAVSYEMGLLLAAPLGLCLFLLAITLAVMARAAPQLNIYSVGFTLQVFVVLAAGVMLLPEMIRTLDAIVGHTGQALPQLLRAG